MKPQFRDVHRQPWIRRSVNPSRTTAMMTCCFVSSLKILHIPTQATRALRPRQCPGWVVIRWPVLR